MATQQYSNKLAYSKEQLHIYLKRINFFKDGELKDQEIPANYNTLERVIKGHVNSIPYGNLSYIYYKRLLKPEGSYPCDIDSPYTTQGVSTELQDIFKKAVLDEGDGICIEHNLLCAHMLMVLGFNVYLATGNCVDPKAWDQSGVIKLRPNLHAAIIVELNEKQYFLDAGEILGRTPKPILMEEGLIQQVNPLTEYRISRSPYPNSIIQSTNPKHLPWLLESKTKELPNKPLTRRNAWSPLTYTTTSPAYLRDIKAKNYMGLSFMAEKMISPFILMSIETDKGYITLKDNVLEIYSLNGVKTIQLKSEKERREAYSKYFNTKISKDCKEHLKSNL
jgi:arylamine N-acetyltransferase